MAPALPPSADTRETRSSAWPRFGGLLLGASGRFCGFVDAPADWMAALWSR